VVGFLGYEHDRRIALKALAVSAAKQDVHSVFAGQANSDLLNCRCSRQIFSLTLMTYYGVVLLLSGYQADETRIMAQYQAIVDR
jgi:hypothetical protein